MHSFKVIEMKIENVAGFAEVSKYEKRLRKSLFLLMVSYFASC